MFACIFPVKKMAGGFDDHINVQLFPGKIARIFFRDDFYSIPVHRNETGPGLYFSGKYSVNRIVFEKMRECSAVGKVIDRNDLHIFF